MKKPGAKKANTKKTNSKKSKPMKAAPKRTVKKKAAARVSPKKGPAKIASSRRVTAAKRDLATLPSRMILVDVENTSSEERLLSVLEHLKIDRTRQRTDLVAVGNWKAVGSRTGRLLARSGAQLMHSAPATGVRDWSDLWIAVAAGRWIAHARPGDRLDIVSDDHAFDAVADAAAGGGVDFHRISYRTLGGVPEEAPILESPPKRRRRGGRGRPRLGQSPNVPPERSTPQAQRSAAPPPRQPQAASPARHPALAPFDAEAGGGRTASPADIREAVRRLTGGDPQRWVNLDLVGNELRMQGFTRPPGSPRLVTRVRQVEDVEVSPTGMARIKPGSPPLAEDKPEVTAEAPAAKPARPRRPPRRRAASAAARPAPDA